LALAHPGVAEVVGAAFPVAGCALPGFASSPRAFLCAVEGVLLPLKYYSHSSPFEHSSFYRCHFEEGGAQAADPSSVHPKEWN